jgi:hypothetical protein
VSTKPYQKTERQNISELAPFDQERTVLVISFDTLKIRIFSTVGVSGIWFFNASVMVLRDVSDLISLSS